MNTDTAYQRAHELDVKAGFNQRYHQIMAWRWGVADRAMRIAVGVISTIGLVFSVPFPSSGTPGPWEWAGFALAIAGAVFAVGLSVVPFDERERFYNGLFRDWTDVRVRAARLRNCIYDMGSGVDLPDEMADDLGEAIGRGLALDGAEPAAYQGLLARCQNAEETSRGLRKASVAVVQRDELEVAGPAAR